MANDTGTVLVGNQAVEAGLIDQLGTFGEAMMKLKALISGVEA
jgi:ClpP class serine protease